MPPAEKSDTVVILSITSLQVLDCRLRPRERTRCCGAQTILGTVLPPGRRVISMKLLHVYDDRFHQHLNPPGHPERPERLDAVVRGVRSARGIRLIERLPEPADLDLIHLVHTPDYVKRIEEISKAGGGRLDPDTTASTGSWDAAIRSAGAGPIAVQALQDGIADSAFLSLRPPGHHAEADRAMGFCLFNNVAITAAWLAEAGSRVAIFDWDVHHGNGTQHSLYQHPDILFISLHEYPLYPGTGWLDECGTGKGEGLTINIPVAARTGGDLYTAATENVIVPILTEFEPDWLLVSAGYDAHFRDPLASVRLQESDYAVITSMLGSVVPVNRTIFFLEGGYDLQALESSTRATLEAIGRADSDRSKEGPRTEREAWERLSAAESTQKRYWKLT